MATPPGTNRPATIHDIATLCGVAASTVSRALSTPDRVNVRTPHGWRLDRTQWPRRPAAALSRR